MIDWLSWPLAHHVDTWVIALLKGLAAVQKFTILIDVTLLKIELVSSENASFIIDVQNRTCMHLLKLHRC